MYVRVRAQETLRLCDAERWHLPSPEIQHLHPDIRGIDAYANELGDDDPQGIESGIYPRGAMIWCLPHNQGCVHHARSQDDLLPTVGCLDLKECPVQPKRGMSDESREKTKRANSKQ